MLLERFISIEEIGCILLVGRGINSSNSRGAETGNLHFGEGLTAGGYHERDFET
jgi:hypothetical protein